MNRFHAPASLLEHRVIHVPWGHNSDFLLRIVATGMSRANLNQPVFPLQSLLLSDRCLLRQFALDTAEDTAHGNQG